MPAESIQGKPLPRTLCNTTATLKTAIDALRPCSHIVCDLEGRSLGAVGGKLSLITLCAVPSADVPEPHIYLVDAIALSARALQPLYELLRSEAHTKVMFDARSDWSELFHRCGVELARVLDVQLADVDSRASRGETVEQQLARLSPYCSAEHVRKERQCYAQVHRLNSLEACVTEHDIVRRSERVKSSKLRILVLHASTHVDYQRTLRTISGARALLGRSIRGTRRWMCTSSAVCTATLSRRTTSMRRSSLDKVRGT